MEPYHGSPVYLLYIDLRSSVGGGFQPQMARVMKKLAKDWGTAGTAMQHWALMVDDHVYELARKPDGSTTSDPGMQNNPTFKRPKPIPYDKWESERQVTEVGWTKYHYTRKNKGQITIIAQNIAEEMQKYHGLKNNCQHFVTRLYAELGCGYDTANGWSPMSSQILPKQVPILAEMAGNVNDNMLSIALSGISIFLMAIQI